LSNIGGVDDLIDIDLKFPDEIKDADRDYDCG